MKTVRAYIDLHASTSPARTFLIAPDSNKELTFYALKSATREVGRQLDSLGVSAGRKVGFLMNNGYWTTQLFLGVMYSGRVIVPLNALAGNVQLQYILNHSDAEVVLVSPEYEDKLAELLQSAEREITIIRCSEQTGPQWPAKKTPLEACPASPTEADPALLLYTSGSTGLPKGAIHSHRAVISGGENVAGGHGLSADDRVLCVLPVYHINGAMVTVSGPLVSGSSVVMPEKFKVTRFWELAADYQCSWSSLVPTIIKYLLDRVDQEPYKFGGDDRLQYFRFVRSASAPLPAVVLWEWEQTFHIPMIETIGLTETAGTVATNPMPPRERKPGSVGLPYGNEIEIFDQQNAVCPPYTSGEIVIRGDNVLDYYYKNPDATEKAFTDNWFRTGDLGIKDDDGYIFVTGRSKELIIRGGENIAPREIDDVLYKHEAVLEAAAFGVDDENYGQEVYACVAFRDDFQCSVNELIAMCEQVIGKYKSPKKIYVMNELPKGPSGKILRLKLSEIVKSL